MSYIHCLMIRNSKMHRLFVDIAVLTDDKLIISHHSAAFFPHNIGNLRAIYTTYSNDTYYKYWLFSSQNTGHTDIIDDIYYADYTVNRPKRMLTGLISDGYTIVIAEYTSERHSHIPVHITRQSPILKAFASYHSPGLTIWLNARDVSPQTID